MEKINHAQTEPATVVMAGEKRVATNRLNAANSTGPKSAAGKAIVALNPVAHGVYTLCPVIEGMELAADWKRYRKGMLASLIPVGMMEVTIAERIILTAWRQRRVARYETEKIRMQQEEAPELSRSRLPLNDGYDASADVAEVLAEPEWREQSWRRVQWFIKASDGDVFDNKEDAYNLLWDTYAQLGFKRDFDDFWKTIPDPEAWTVGWLRQLIREMATQPGKDFDQLLKDLEEKAMVEFARSSTLAGKLKRNLDDYRRAHLLPDEGTLEKVTRYEAHLARQFHRDLHELQRLQALRHGFAVPVPLAIDIDVTGVADGKANGD